MKIETARVVNATRLELVIISYEAIIDDMDDAISYIECNMKEEVKTKLKNANDFIKELVLALDMKYEISSDLRRLYDYVERLLISAMISYNIEKIKEARKIIVGLMNSFKQLEDKENKTEKVMSNYEKIYSGFTYGMFGLNEVVIGNEKRGIKA